MSDQENQLPRDKFKYYHYLFARKCEDILGEVTSQSLLGVNGFKPAVVFTLNSFKKYSLSLGVEIITQTNATCKEIKHNVSKFIPTNTLFAFATNLF